LHSQVFLPVVLAPDIEMQGGSDSVVVKENVLKKLNDKIKKTP
jgi:hypothetical protein